ncbi:DUF6096 family protein [Cohnella sp. GCM10020058]|uniref:DUF6096 family protein n=1 Tax=Cohnella sp. GCM10020058 TaxID=3317330 RepID=UPI003628D3CE
MRYSELQFGSQELKLRLAASNTIALEKQLGGRSPLDVLLGMERGEMVSVTNLLTILHAASQKFQHGVSMQKIMDLYDEYVESGNTYTDLLPALLDVLRVSGFFKEAPTTEPETTIQ